MAIGIDFVRDYLRSTFRKVIEGKKSNQVVGFLLPSPEFKVVMVVDNDAQILTCRIPDVLKVADYHKVAVLEKAMAFNHRFLLGKFTFDPEDSEMAFEVNHSTMGFQEPWRNYDKLMHTMLAAVLCMEDEIKILRDMNTAGGGAGAAEVGEETVWYDSPVSYPPDAFPADPARERKGCPFCSGVDLANIECRFCGKKQGT